MKAILVDFFSLKCFIKENCPFFDCYNLSTFLIAGTILEKKQRERPMMKQKAKKSKLSKKYSIKEKKRPLILLY